MQQYILFAVLGLGSGAVYATVSQGLVMMHRASGVINFAHGALAMYAIYVYAELRQQGALLLPIPGLWRVHLAHALAFPVALLLAVGSTALLGGLVYVLVFRPLERAPVLAKIVATVGLLIGIAGLVQVWFPSQSTTPLYVDQVLPQHAVKLFGAAVPSDRLWLSALAVATALALTALSRFTSFGLATRAAAASPKGAVLTGRDPYRIALGNWILASAVAGVFGVLVAPMMSIAPDSVILLVVPSLAAAMVARFQSYWIACLTGLALGVLESELTSLQTIHQSLPQGLETFAPLIVIVLVAYLRGHTTVRRDDLFHDRLPLAPRPRHVARNVAVSLALGALALTLTHGDVRLGLIVSLIGAIVCLSIVLLTGFAGQVSLMQMTFTGLAGLLLSPLGARAGIPFPLAPLLAVLAACALGLVVGLPALRVRGTSLAVVTLSAAVATERLIFNNSAITGGIQGNAVTAPRVLGLDLDILGPHYPRLAFGLFTLAVAAVAALVVANLRISPSGMRMLAVRANERAAAASGMNVAQTKLLAFALAALIAGCAGTLFAYQQVRLSTATFGVLPSLVFLAWAYLGGITSVTGAFVAGLLVPGGLVITLVDKAIDFGRYESLVAGVLLMVTAVVNPNGMAGVLHEHLGQVRGLVQRRRRARVDPTTVPASGPPIEPARRRRAGR